MPFVISTGSYNYDLLCILILCIVVGKGLTLVGSVVEGDYSEKYASALAAKQTVTAMMKREQAPGFAEVIVADSTVQGLSYLYVGCCILVSVGSAKKDQIVYENLYCLYMMI